MFLFLFLGPLLLLAVGGSGVDVVVFVDCSEASCVCGALGPSCTVNAADGIVAFVCGVGKRIGHSLFRSATRTVLLPMCSMHSMDSQSNVGLWGRRSMSAMRLVPNVGT